jgi:predicted RNA-binding protein
MCEANAYLVGEDGKETLLLEAVDKVFPQDNNLILESIFGERRILKARVKELALVDHKILLEK